MLRLMKSWKLSIATVRGNTNRLDAAGDAMDSPALLHVALAKLKTVTIQTTLTQDVDTEEEDDTQNLTLWNLLYGQRSLCIRW